MVLAQKNNLTANSTERSQEGAFDPGRLIQELVSLGHPRITREVAQDLTQEVAAVLGASPKRDITALWVSQVVEQRLRNRGILGGPPKQQVAELKVSPFEDETLSLSETAANRTQGLLQKGQATTLPTLEKFLTSPNPARPETGKVHPPPPRASIQLHGTHQETSAAWEQRFVSVAQRAAAEESRWASPVDSETLAVEFYNTMANQEFYPHVPELLQGRDDGQAKGAGQIWMDLPLGAESTEMVLKDAHRAWCEGMLVSFILRGDDGEAGFTTESYEGFLQAVEKALLELPENLPIPPMVGLHLEMAGPQVLSWARLALSGSYYPKFSLCLALPSFKADLSEQEKEDLDALRTQGPLLLRHELIDSLGPKTFPRWSGGPELEPYEICQLGSINLAILACGSDVDWVKLRRIIRTAVHCLDNLIESQSYPLETIAQHSRANRKIGLGVMGLAELLNKLSIPYQSEQATILAEKTMRFIQHEALEASHQLAVTRGVFPNYSQSPWKQAGRKLRHRTLTAVCPAPALAALAGVTPGFGPLEPMRKEIPTLCSARMQSAVERHSDGPAGICYDLTDETISLSDFLTQALGGAVKQIHLAQDLRPRLITLRQAPALDLEITPILAVPPVEEAEAELTDTELTETEVTEETTPPLAATAEEEVTEVFSPVVPRPMPEILEARIHRVQTFHGEMKVTLGFDPHGPYELLARVGKSGSEVAAQAEALSRLISLLLSVGVEPQRIYRELKDIQWVPNLDAMGTSIPDGLAQIISLEFPEQPAVRNDGADSDGQEEITEILEAGTLH